MKIAVIRSKNCFWAIAICFALLAGPAQAQQGAVDGDLWLRSTEGERRAFLVGMTSMLGMVTAWSEKQGAAPSAAAAMTAQALREMTLDQVSSRITRWYHANSARRHMPVMGVLWLDIVQPAATGGGVKGGKKPSTE